MQKQDNNDKENQKYFEGKNLIKILVAVSIITLPLIYFAYKKKLNNGVTITDEKIGTLDISQQIESLEQKVSETPSYDNLINLSALYLNNKMAKKAIPLLFKCDSLSPSNAIVSNNFGIAYMQLLDYDLALSSLQKALQIDSTFQLAKNNLNWAKSEKEKLMLKISEMENTPEKDRTFGFYIDLGLNYQLAKKYQKSIYIWNKAIDIDSKDPRPYNNIGVSLIYLKKYDEAISILNKAIELNPDFQLAKNNLQWAKDEKSKK